MTRTGWITVFVLGLGAGYSLALWLGAVPSPEKHIAGEQPNITQSPANGRIKQQIPAAGQQPSSESGAEVAELLLKLPVFAQRGDWVGLIQATDVLAQHDNRYAGRLVPYLEQAYAALARSALDHGDSREASRWLDEANRRLGENGPRLLLQAELDQVAGRGQAALENLHRVIELDPQLAERVYPQIRQLVEALAEFRSGPLTLDQKIALLNEEIVSDPGHAPYYALLGRLYYQQGYNEQAVANLEYAMQLDPSLAPQLSSLVGVVQQRQGSPGLVEVSLMGHGHSLYVEAQLNNSARRYRLVLDTGASLTAISAGTARMLGIAVRDDMPRIQLSTAKGVTHAPLVTLHSVQVGGALVENVQAVILPELEGADGLLGLSFLNQFDMDINQGERKLLLSPRL